MDFEIHTIETGTFALDGGAMFGIVPKTLWMRTNPTDENNRIQLALRCLLIITPRDKILIDTGLGNKFEEKYKEIYKQNNSEFTLESSLKKYGILKSEITKIIITHLHFDHAGGNTEKIGDEIVPTFKNASYYVQKEHLLWAQSPSPRDRASFLKNDFEVLIQAGQLIPLQGETQIIGGIELIISNGHTRAQQLPLIKAGEKKIFYCGDLVPTTSHLPLTFCMGYDNEPLKTIEEKEKILSIAVKENWILVFEHDPKIKACTIMETEKGFKIKEEVRDL